MGGKNYKIWETFYGMLYTPLSHYKTQGVPTLLVQSEIYVVNPGVSAFYIATEVAKVERVK